MDRRDQAKDRRDLIQNARPLRKRRIGWRTQKPHQRFYKAADIPTTEEAAAILETPARNLEQAVGRYVLRHNFGELVKRLQAWEECWKLTTDDEDGFWLVERFQCCHICKSPTFHTKKEWNYFADFNAHICPDCFMKCHEVIEGYSAEEFLHDFYNDSKTAASYFHCSNCDKKVRDEICVACLMGPSGGKNGPDGKIVRNCKIEAHCRKITDGFGHYCFQCCAEIEAESRADEMRGK
jgi:hypothetical protein